MKTRKTRLGLTRFTSFDNQTGSSDGTDKCASSSASYFRAFSSSTLLLPSWHPDPTVGVWERRAAPRELRGDETRRQKNCPTKTGRQRERNVVNSQRKRLEAYRSGLSRRRLALSKPLDWLDRDSNDAPAKRTHDIRKRATMTKAKKKNKTEETSSFTSSSPFSRWISE